MFILLVFIIKRKINYPVNFIIQLIRKKSQTHQVHVYMYTQTCQLLFALVAKAELHKQLEAPHHR